MLQKAQPTMVEVHQLFEKWRRNKKRRERIPAALWDAAVSLSRHNSANQIARLLKLNHTAVRDRIRAHKQGGIWRKTPAFIELEPSVFNAQADMTAQGTAAECVIEMEKPGGVKMKICFKGNCPDIIGLSKTFLGEA
jgi:hypothetical protein